MDIELDIEMGESSLARFCPKCQSRHIARFVYGMPGNLRDLARQQMQGKIVMAGCEYYPGAPHYRCNKCLHEW